MSAINISVNRDFDVRKKNRKKFSKAARKNVLISRPSKKFNVLNIVILMINIFKRHKLTTFFNYVINKETYLAQINTIQHECIITAIVYNILLCLKGSHTYSPHIVYHKNKNTYT